MQENEGDRQFQETFNLICVYINLKVFIYGNFFFKEKSGEKQKEIDGRKKRKRKQRG